MHTTRTHATPAKMARALADPTEPAPGQDAVAWDRPESDPCERGTVGCSVRHTRDSECETW